MCNKMVGDSSQSHQASSFAAPPAAPFSADAPLLEKMRHGYDPMLEGVRWSERYSERLEWLWSRMPGFVGRTLATTAIFMLGASVQGDWVIIGIHFLRQFGYLERLPQPNSSAESTALNGTVGDGLTWLSLATYVDVPKYQHFWYFAFTTAIGSYAIYFSIGGFLHWYFYVRQRDRANEWKCQPHKFLTPEVERHEIIFGSCAIIVVSIISGLIASYSFNGGTYQRIYYDPLEFGWLWLFAQVPVVFIYQDYAMYWMHRMYHIPFLYKHFHKMHHKYKQPTAFSVTALHPVEIAHMQLVMAMPLFVIPVHWAMFYAVGMYVFYHGILDHSGIAFKAQWWQPWQPDAIFHDNHHQYTHVNFSFNMSIWDKIHGTYRRKDRVYDENIFYGKGLALDEVPEDVLLRDIAERNSENPLAYTDNVNVNQLNSTEEIVKKVKKTKAT